MARCKLLTTLLLSFTLCSIIGVNSAPSNLTDAPSTDSSTTTGLPTTTLSPQDTCDLSSGSCDSCVSSKSCFYCNSDEKCYYMPFKVLKPIPESCPLMKDIMWGTCIVSYRTVWIVVGSIGGALLLVIVICCCCCCRSRSGGSSVVSGDWLKWEKNRQVRQVVQDDRRKERQTRMDDMRTKYGLKKDEDSKYNKF